MNRFVIHRHSKVNEAIHWDIMFEQECVLETYRVDLAPKDWSGHVFCAERIFDHPLKFLTYEGSVNKGTGKVQIAETGTYKILSDTLQEKKFLLEGTVAQGKLVFNSTGPDKWQVSYKQA